MSPSQIVPVFWNGESGIARAFVEELGWAMQTESRLIPVIVERDAPPTFRVGPWDSASQHPLKRLFDRSVLGAIAYAPLASLAPVVKKLASRAVHEHAESVRFLLTGTAELFGLLGETPPRSLCLIEPDPGAAPFLYGLAAAAQRQAAQSLEFLTIILGMDRVERAARYFAELQEDAGRAVGSALKLRFCGSLSPSQEKLVLLQKTRGRLLAESYAGDAFSGQLKVASRMLAKGLALQSGGDETEFGELVSRLSRWSEQDAG